MEKNLRVRSGLSGSFLKGIASVTMIIDHVGAYLLQYAMDHHGALLQQQGMYDLINIFYWMCRLIGRLAFPIYAFLIVEGFLHTKHLKKYALTLLAFAFLSEVPFDLASFQTPLETTYQNVFFTLFLGLMTLYGFQKMKSVGGIPWIALLIGGGLAELIRSDYGAYGVGIIFLFYILREDHQKRDVIVGLLSLYQYTAPLALIPIHFYNGQRGSRIKYFFYALYPVHLGILYWIQWTFL